MCFSIKTPKVPATQPAPDPGAAADAAAVLRARLAGRRGYAAAIRTSPMGVKGFANAVMRGRLGSLTATATPSTQTRPIQAA